MRKIWRYPRIPTTSQGTPMTPFSIRLSMNSEQFGSIRHALDEVAQQIAADVEFHCRNCGYVKPE
jgi:hypothetical protein